MLSCTKCTSKANAYKFSCNFSTQGLSHLRISEFTVIYCIEDEEPAEKAHIFSFLSHVEDHSVSLISFCQSNAEERLKECFGDKRGC